MHHEGEAQNSASQLPQHTRARCPSMPPVVNTHRTHPRHSAPRAAAQQPSSRATGQPHSRSSLPTVPAGPPWMHRPGAAPGRARLQDTDSERSVRAMAEIPCQWDAWPGGGCLSPGDSCPAHSPPEPLLQAVGHRNKGTCHKEPCINVSGMWPRGCGFSCPCPPFLGHPSDQQCVSQGTESAGHRGTETTAGQQGPRTGAHCVHSTRASRTTLTLLTDSLRT